MPAGSDRARPREGAGQGIGIAFEQTIPILRIFDLDKAREFYLGFLGFAVDWEHRLGEGFPLYTQISRGGLRLHLSEHAGDATPGGGMVVYTSGLRELHRELSARDYPYMRPDVEEQPWGPEMALTDPFGTRIRFVEQRAAPS